MRRLVLLLAVLVLASGCARTTVGGTPVAQAPLDVSSPFDKESSSDPSASEEPDPETAPIRTAQPTEPTRDDPTR